MTTGSRVAEQARRGCIVMAILHPSARGPLPKIAPLLIEALQDEGWAVTSTSWGGRRPDETRAFKVVSRSWELLKAWSHLALQPGAVLFVNSSPSRKGTARDLPLVLGARLLGHKAIVLWHGSDPRVMTAHRHSRLARGCALLSRCTDAILVLSAAELDGWRRALPRGSFFQVTNPYVAKMPPSPEGADRSCAILFVGRVMRAKGVFELLEAFDRLSATRACSLSIVGDGPDMPAVLDWIDRHGLAALTELPGYLDEAGVRQLYARADMFVLPTSHAEGFPTVVSEAMDAGLPIVTTRRGGTPDHLEEGVNALFVQVGDVAGLEAAIARLMDDPQLRRTMGAANRVKVQSFAPKVVVRQYLRVLDYVTEASRVERARRS